MATTVHVSPRTAALPVHALYGAAAGLVGGVGMGIWMSVSRPMMDTAMIIMVAGLLGSTNAFVGWLIHVAIAVFAGTGAREGTAAMVSHRGMFHFVGRPVRGTAAFLSSWLPTSPNLPTTGGEDY
ncbi:hypothetical protein [Streptomyces sp. NPDC001292]|uniref:hypothetical protein n=1 Tax=Streptomyces sp. NPDC001292 TaxID=3364558 RepID=UPI0036C77494